MTKERIIKKYPNRRLYDTAESKYITFTDIRDLVMAGIKFTVQDSASKEDLTRQILMQIIIEEESGGRPLFSADMLSQLIRFYGGTMQGVFTRYLEDSFNIFASQQNDSKEDFIKNPVDAFNTMNKKNLEMWSNMQKSFTQTSVFSPKKPDKS